MYGLVIGVFLLGYSGYCWREQGIHSRYEGWKTREEAPRTFKWMLILYVFLALSMILSTAFFPSKR